MALRRIDEQPPARAEGAGFADALAAGSLAGRLSDTQIAAVQEGITLLLAEQIRKYTAGDASSVKDETAAALLASIYFCLRAGTAAAPDPSDFFALLREKGVRALFETGTRRVRACLRESKRLYRTVLLEKLELPLAAYNDTLTVSLPEFFKNYDVEFAAHEVPCSMDYPLAFDLGDVQGVFYIRDYLRSLRLETRFCRRFGQKRLVWLLSRFEEKFRMHLLCAPLNLFEIVSDQLLFSVLCENEPTVFTVTAPQFARLKTGLSGKTGAEIAVLAQTACSRIAASCFPADARLAAYLHRYAAGFAQRLALAAESGGLAQMVFVEKFPAAQEDCTVFQDGARMRDEPFARLVERVGQCESAAQKAEIVAKNVPSVRDYIDLLESDCLYEGEYPALFDRLDDTMLAVLGQLLFNDELRCGAVHLTPENARQFAKTAGQEWQKAFVAYLLRLPQSRRSEIENAMSLLRVTDAHDDAPSLGDFPY